MTPGFLLRTVECARSKLEGWNEKPSKENPEDKDDSVRIQKGDPHVTGPRARGAAVCHDTRRFFSEARATPPPISGLMTSSSTLTL
jgi:hypothetical protein